MLPEPSRHAAAALLVTLLVVGLLPGTVAGQTAGGTIVVEEGETVSEVDAVAGSVIVRGTVTGDVSAAAGNVIVEGTVEGNVNVASGNLWILGTVEGDVSAGAGSVALEEGGVVVGNFEVGAGTVRIDGEIGGDATVGADTVTLGENAAIAGSLTYDGTLEGNRDAVAGEITRDPSLGSSDATDRQPFASWAFAVYAFFVNLVLGAILLAVFPRFSESVADRVAADPLRSGLVGLGVAVGVPILLVLLLVTIVGIPISLAGLIAFAVFAWIGLVYGRFAVGAWLLSLVDADNRWLALVLGLSIGAVLSVIPIVGGLLNAAISLLGLGALSSALYESHRRRRLRPSPPPERGPDPSAD